MSEILNLDVMKGLKTLEDQSVNCCVTSPPYWALRDYGVPGQLGLEATPDEYISKMVEVFREVRRVLRDDGTLWLNIGDSYAVTGKNRTEAQATANSTLRGGTDNQKSILKQQSKIVGDLKAKDLVGIPWMLAFALRADGWYLRSDIIWSKPNPMPESVTDRPTKAHEYIFLLSKSKSYYYDAESIKEPLAESVLKDKRLTDPEYKTGRIDVGYPGANQNNGGGLLKPKAGQRQLVANKRTVWTVATTPFTEAHFATFPEDLIKPCILAGCPENGIVLDPFMGAGTTALVSLKLNRQYVGFELNPEYITITERRIRDLKSQGKLFENEISIMPKEQELPL